MPNTGRTNKRVSPGAPGRTINAFFQKQPALLCIVPRMVPTIVTLSVARSYHVFTYSWKSLYTFPTYRANWTDWTASMLDLTGNFSLIYFRKQGSSFHVRDKFSGCNVRRDRSLQQRQHHRMRLRTDRKVNSLSLLLRLFSFRRLTLVIKAAMYVLESVFEGRSSFCIA